MLKKLISIYFILTLMYGLMNPVVKAAKPDDIYLPGWTVSFNEDGNNDTKGEALVDNSEKHTGENSVKLVFKSSQGTNRYVTLKSEKIPLKGGTTYKFGFWVKLGASTRLLSVRLNWGAKNLLTDKDGKTKYGTTSKVDWEYYEYSYTPETDASESLLFMIEGYSSNGAWIDDAEVYECDGSGNKIGKNMLANPGFEQTGNMAAIEMNYWTAAFNNAATSAAGGYAAGDAAIVQNENGGHSLNISFPMMAKSNRYMVIKSMPLNFDADKKYKWEFSMKSADRKKIGVRIGWKTDRTNITPENSEWARYSGICSPSGMQQLLIIVEDYSPNGIMIDDAAIYECDDNGNPLSENILPNPDFEDNDILMEVQQLNVDRKENSLTFTWQNPDYANYTEILLYEINAENGLNLSGTAQRTDTSSIVLSNLTDIPQKRYVIKTAYPAAGYESEGISIGAYLAEKPCFDLLESAEPSADGEFTVLKEDIKALEKGYIRSSVNIANNYMGESFKPTLLAALYNGESLCDIQTVSSYVKEGDTLNGAPETFGLIFNVPDLENGNYSMKVFIWNDETMMPLSNNVPILN